MNGISPVDAAPSRPGFFQRSRFFWISVAAHVLLIAVATILVVQNIALKKRTAFESAERGPKISTRALEYKVAAPQASGGSAPLLAKRITAKSASKVALPEMPAMPEVSEVLPVSMPGLGGAGLGAGLGSGAGTGAGGNGGPSSGGTLFGFRERSGGSLVGTFYDLKQTPDRQPTGMTPEKYLEILAKAIQRGFPEREFEKYFKAPRPLYATQLFIPVMSAAEGPAAFDVADLVQERMWVVIYKGRISPPENGTYYFVGGADDCIAIKMRGRVVMQACRDILHDWDRGQGSKYYPTPMQPPKGFPRGAPMALQAGTYYNVEILIGECPGSEFFAQVLVEKSGVKYEEGPGGNPLLPAFRVADTPTPTDGRIFPYQSDGPIWKAERVQAPPAP